MTLDSGRNPVGESTNTCVVMVKMVVGMRIGVG